MIPTRSEPETDIAHAMSIEDLSRSLAVEPDAGLSRAEVEQRRRLSGSNVLATRSATSVFGVLYDQLRSVVVLLLVAATAAGLLVGEVVEAAAIAVVLVVNTVVGFLTELRAVRSMEALQHLTPVHAEVQREGRRDEIDAADLVPGDVVALEAGDNVPADLRLSEAFDFSVDESALTGESVPVSKHTRPLESDVPLAERANMAYMGTVVRTGRAEGIAVATGMRTEVGRVAELTLATPTTQAPLQVGLERLGRLLSVVVIGLAIVLAVLGTLRGLDLREVIEVSIALAVAIVPEGLPAVATLTLTVGMRRMAAERALVRRLAVVETLGSTTVIASDKTGTLTANRIVVADVVVAEGRDEDALWETAVLCNDADIAPDGDPVGDPTEVALLRAAGERGVDWRTLRQSEDRRAEVPFTSETKRMVVVVGDVAHVKGAPEVVIDAERDPDLLAAATAMAARGLRTLAIASRAIPPAVAERLAQGGDLLPDLEASLFSRLDVLGVAGMHDPVRPEAVAAVETCHRAGIRVLMVTGDLPGTAKAVAEELGLRSGGLTTGRELDALDDDARAERVRQTDVLARVAPEHKLRIVRALQSQGEVVAVTGDGVNDAPALRQADVGVAMGLTGTDVARQAADIVLTDDDFATIESAIEEGRRVFTNIRRFGQYLFSWHLSMLFVVTGALAAGLPAPLGGLMILWNNLIIDVIPSFALALEPSAEEAMRQPPRPRSEPVLGRGALSRIVSQGALVGGVGITAFLLSYGVWGLPLAESRTASFITLTGAQLLAVFNARREDGHGFAGLSQSPWLWIALVVTLTLEGAALGFVPLRDLLGLAIPDAERWPVLAGLALLPLGLTQARRVMARWPVKLGAKKS